MTRPALFVIALGALAPAAGAQDIWDDPGGVEFEWDAEAALVVAPFVEEPPLFLIRGEFGANYVLDNGVEIGARTAVEVRREHPARPDFTGFFPPEGAAGPQPPGAFSRFGRGERIDDAGTVAEIDVAYIYMEGGYGELRLGADEGVAMRFFEGGPALFSEAGLVNPELDPTGQLLARTEHDLTGPSGKLSYASPRILGLRAGISYTPETSLEDFDDDLADRLGTGVAPELKDAVEIALNLSRRLPQSGVRLRAGLAWSRADVNYTAAPGLYGAVETWSAGGSAVFGDITLGGSWLSSNNGIAARSGDYSAWSLSAAKAVGRFDFVAEYAEAEDKFAALTSDSWQAGIAWRPEPGWRLAAGWRDETLRTGLLPGESGASSRDGRRGIVLEITRSR